MWKQRTVKKKIQSSRNTKYLSKNKEYFIFNLKISKTINCGLSIDYNLVQGSSQGSYTMKVKLEFIQKTLEHI